jgi:electron transport complex protein RnfB
MRRDRAARIDEPRCIGCARCIEVCPVDAIVGAQGWMHTVVEDWCIGCDLCAPACPVDCIEMVAPSRPWTEPLKRAAARRGKRRRTRLAAPAIPPRSVEERRRILAQILARKRG